MVTGSGLRKTPLEAETLLAQASGALPPLSIGAGEDDFLRLCLVRAFRGGGEREGAEFVRLEGDALDASDLAQALQGIALFGAGRRIWIREGAKLERAAETLLLEWASGGAEGARVLVTTARRIEELKSLQALAAAGLWVDCVAAPRDRATWVTRILSDAGLKLPARDMEALAARRESLLALAQEVGKLRAHADPSGHVPPQALEALALEREGASTSRWAAALLEGDATRTRAEAVALDAEGTPGSSCLWAVADLALAVLEPQAFSYRRGRSAAPPLGPTEARRVLDAVYRVDRGLKRGEMRDQEVRGRLEQLLRPGRPGADGT